MREEQRIAVIADRRFAYTGTLLRGIVKYIRPARPWMIHTWSSDGRWGPRDATLLRAWRPTGILAQGLKPELIDDVAALGIPLVDMSTSPQFPQSPYVGIDQAAIGRMVAEEFLAQGLRHAAYFGWIDQTCEQQFAGLRDGFSSMSGTTVHRVDAAAIPPDNEALGPAAADAFLAQWLATLPTPLGLMLFDDFAATWLTQACLQAGLRVPEDIAIIGVYDDATNCEFAYPAVSSVEVPGERAGYEAARVLDQIMHDGEIDRSRTRILLPPIGVVTRRSSDLVAVEDPEVASAVRFIRLNAHRPLKVSEVLKSIEISPRRLEQRFKKALGRTAAAEILRVHLNRAAQLLAQTNLPLRAIATRSGFADIHHLCHAFRRVRGLTPNQYRRPFAIGSSPSAGEE
jgi:LacI family transcriptional regulator